MAYIINKSNGSTLTIINDFNVDNTSTSLVLVGKGYKDWGEHINENFVKLLENFANSTPPVNPLNGQLWYDTNDNSLKIYNSVTNSWNNIQVNFGNLNFYYQEISSPLSGNITGFINNDKIVGLFSDIAVSADKLDDGSIFPSVNAQTQFPNGIGVGLNLGNNYSNIYGQNILRVGVINLSGINVSLEINNNGKIFSYNDLESKGTTVVERTLVSGSNIARPRYYLPTSAGFFNNVLVSQGNNNGLVWKDVNTLLVKDMIEGHSGSDYTYILASSPTYSINFYTKDTLRMILNENGDLCLGTNINPNYRLQIENNASSNNVSLGLINLDPSLNTSINLEAYFDTGNSANINFIRGGSLYSPILPGETLGSINWYGINNAGEIQNTVKIRSVVVTAQSSTISCNIEFLNSDVSGNYYKCLEVRNNGEIAIYYNNGSDFYILPTSGGNDGDILTTNTSTKRLMWKPLQIENQEVLITAFSLVGLSSFTTRDLQPNSKRVIYMYNFTPQQISRYPTVLFMNKGGNTNGSGFVARYSRNVSNVIVSANTMGRLTRVSMDTTHRYFAKIVINVDHSSKVMLHSEIFDNVCEERNIAFFTNSGLAFTECTAVQIFLTGSAGFTRGSAKIVDIINPTPPFTIN